MATKTKTVTKKTSKPAGTAPPTGMSISRSGNSFTFSWKVGDEDYSAGQWIAYNVNDGGWTGDIAVHTSLSSYQVDWTATDVWKISFRARGQRKEYTTQQSTSSTNKKTKVKTITNTTITWKPVASDWAGIDWYAEIPTAPTLSYTRTTSNSGTFTWSAEEDNSGRKIFKDVELQTVVVANTENPPGYGWSASSVGKTGSQTYTESLSSGNVVRWIRVRSRGPAGVSDWVYDHHAYGSPATPMLQSASAELAGTATRVTAAWYAPFSILNPIDTVTLQYVIAIPTTVTLSAPSTGWTDSVSVGGNGGWDKIVTNISDQVDYDECMWVRLKATHDGFETFSSAACVFKGTLKTPEISAVPNVTSGNVAITITENTDCTVAGTVIFYRSEKRPNYDQVVAVLPNGTTTTSVYIEEIKTSYVGHVDTTCFGAYAFVGSYTELAVNAVMRSGIDTDSDILARPPEWLELSEGSISNTVRIRWPWSWTAATSAELAWADHDDAWESTDEPSTYEVKDRDIMSWIIAKLKAGRKWFFRVRLNYSDGDDEIIGPWSEMYDYDLSSVPDKPALILSKSVINADGTVTARWAYSSDDGTTQTFADICQATISGGTVTYGNMVAHVSEGQTVEISQAWTTGTTYYFCLRLTSSAGRQSEWSDPVRLYIAPQLQISVTEHSLEEDEHGFLFLTELPLTVTATGAGASGQTIVSIVRAEEYHIYRPDDSEFDGFEGEHIATHTQNGEAQVTITTDDLIGALDDGAKYKLICTVIDEYGQKASAEYLFTVDWDHQAGKPSATVTIDDWQRIAIITPIAPDNYESGDVCDIYRISSDKPELIVEGAAFGTTYVDPYPAFGWHCGHRIVTRTANGDYITADNHLAWFNADSDIGDIIEEESMIIDVNGEQIELPYNIELQSTWSKDFKRTSYLGGSVQGDWNPAVTRDMTANTVIIRGRDLDTQLSMRNLAGYAGPAHIRTPEGTSVSADIQVRESWSYQTSKVTYSLAIKVIDPEEPEGMTYTEWQNMNPVG